VKKCSQEFSPFTVTVTGWVVQSATGLVLLTLSNEFGANACLHQTIAHSDKINITGESCKWVSKEACDCQANYELTWLQINL